VLAELKVVNRGNRSTLFDEHRDRVRLRVAGDAAKEAPKAEEVIEGTFYNLNKKIKPDTSQLGLVVFALPREKLKVLYQRGADAQLIFFEKSPPQPAKGTTSKGKSAAKGGPSGPDGGIRLWQ
jgi:hypothetical protein